MSSAATGAAAVLRVLALLALFSPARTLAADEKDPAPRPPPRARVVVKPGKKAPARAPLPPAGEHPAEDLLSIAGLLSGRTVRIESDRVREVKIAVTESAAGAEVNLDELKVLLAAHRIYLFPFTDPKEGEIIVASKNPQWTNEPPRHTRIIDVGAAGFQGAWEKVRKAVEERNKSQPKGEPAVFAVPDERTGKIFLGAPSAEALEGIAKLVEEKKAEDPDRPHLYTYTGVYRPVRDLEKDLLEKLSEADRNRLRVVVSSRGNRLLLRAPSSVWERVEAELKKLDQKP